MLEAHRPLQLHPATAGRLSREPVANYTTLSFTSILPRVALE
jgi:hypothetical protein